METCLLKHSQEFSEKYPGKYVAIIKDELVAIGNSSIEVFEKAKDSILMKKYL